MKKFGTQSYAIKPFQLKQVNKATQFTRSIRRININEKRSDKTMKWQWCDDGPSWKDYDIKINKAIENSYGNNKNSYQFTVNGKKKYEILFATLKQRNLSTNFERDVRRVPLNTKINSGRSRNKKDNEIRNSSLWDGPKRKTFGSKILTLYHVTDKKAANAIAKSGKMIRGKDGMFGGGIYFAESVESANYKSEHKGGWVITARVLVGKEHVVKGASAGKFDYQKLQSMGFDSIHAPNGSGGGKSERVVYNYDQVCIVSVKKTN